VSEDRIEPPRIAPRPDQGPPVDHGEGLEVVGGQEAVENSAFLRKAWHMGEPMCTVCGGPHVSRCGYCGGHHPDDPVHEGIIGPLVEARTSDLMVEVERLRKVAGDRADQVREAEQEIARLERILAVTREREHDLRTLVATTSAGWQSAHEMHSRHHWCVDKDERTRPFKIGEKCPTLWALEQGRAVTP
jgi:hypothetical protein